MLSHKKLILTTSNLMINIRTHTQLLRYTYNTYLRYCCALKQCNVPTTTLYTDYSTHFYVSNLIQACNAVR